LSKRRVVITGLGAITCLANTVSETWDGIINGKSGISAIDSFDISPFASTFGGVIRNFDVSQYVPEKDAKRMDGFIHYGIAAGSQAIEDSGLEITEANAERIGVAIGAGIGGITGIEECYATYEKGGPRRISPFFVPGNIINMISGNLSIKYGLKGPNFAIVTACTTGTHNIGDAARLIKYGDADVMIAGGAERCTTSPTAMGGFASAKALSRRNDDPQAASRPWDKDRDGFVLSDGAGVVVLEELEACFALTNGYMNMSSYAYRIRPQVESLTKKKIGIASLVVTLSRLRKEFKKEPPLIHKVDIENITTKLPLSEIVYENTSKFITELESLHKNILISRDDFFTTNMSTKKLILFVLPISRTKC